MSSQVPPQKPTVVKFGPPMGSFYVHSYMESAERFINLFREVASKIPGACSDMMTLHWNPISPSSPYIILSPSRVLQTDDGTDAGVAMTDSNGVRLQFSGPAIEAAEDRIGLAIIAHELAHVTVFAAVTLGLLEGEELELYERARNNQQQLIEYLEQVADQRAKSWGFNQHETRQWVASYLRDEGIELG